MAYVPQFIPTDLSAFQGIMDRAQQKHDYNTQRQEQLSDTIASMTAPTAFDQQMKDQIRQQLADTVTKLDKTHNYDRAGSQYAKDLSNALLQVKGNPYFSYKAEADKLTARRDAAKDKLQGDFFEGNDPFAMTPENNTLEARMASLKKWQPLSLKDVELAGGLKGQALAKELNSFDKMNDPRFKGWYLSKQVTGSPTLEAAYATIDENPSLIDEAIEGTAFAQYKDDPNVRGRVRESMARQMLGDTKISPLQNPFERPVTGTQKTVKPNYNYSYGLGFTDPPGQGASAIDDPDKFRDYSNEVAKDQANVDKLRAEYDKMPAEKKLANKAAMDQAEADLFFKRISHSKVKTIMDDVEYNTSQGIAARESGINLIKTYAPVKGLTDETAEKYYDRLKEAYLYSSKWQRSMPGQGATLLLDALTNIVPTYLDEAGAMRAAEKGMSAIPQIKKDSIKSRDEALAKINDAKSRNAIFEAYNVWGEMLEKASTDGTFKDKNATFNFLQNSKKFFNQFEDFYSGNGNYAYGQTNALPSFRAVEDMQRERLEKGVSNLYEEQVQHPFYDATKKKQISTHLAENLNRWDLLDERYVKGEGENWKTLKSPLQSKLVEAARKGQVKMTFHTNPDAPLLIQLTHDDGTSGLFKLDPDKVGTQELVTLATLEPNEKVRHSIYAAMFSHVQFPEGDEDQNSDLSKDNPASRQMKKVLGSDVMDKITNKGKDPLYVRQGKIKTKDGNIVNGYILTDVTKDAQGNDIKKVFTYENRVDLTFALALLAGIPQKVEEVSAAAMEYEPTQEQEEPSFE